jgi:hypothetical protein
MYTQVILFQIKNMARVAKSFSVAMYILGSGSRAEALDKASIILQMEESIKGKFGTASHMGMGN